MGYLIGQAKCLTGARFTMNAELLKWSGITVPRPDDVAQEPVWSTYQDPITKEILNEWVPVDSNNVPITDATTPVTTIACLARGIVDGGIRVAGTTERFGDTYENIDFVKMWVPANVVLNKRDRITNIRDKQGGRVIWIDEEYDTGNRPTIFNVNGVTPLFDAMNRHTENFVLLEKAEDYG